MDPRSLVSGISSCSPNQLRDLSLDILVILNIFCDFNINTETAWYKLKFFTPQDFS